MQEVLADQGKSKAAVVRCAKEWPLCGKRVGGSGEVGGRKRERVEDADVEENRGRVEGVSVTIKEGKMQQKGRMEGTWVEVPAL